MAKFRFTNKAVEGLYGFIAGRHIIFYHVISDNEIEVIRILHGSMDLKNRMGE